MRRRGVGKELLSRAIHNESERAGGPYIAVNCQLYADSVLGQTLWAAPLPTMKMVA
nr:Nif-specific regulatory protein [Klebsiella pneumoniae]